MKEHYDKILKILVILESFCGLEEKKDRLAEACRLFDEGSSSNKAWQYFRFTEDFCLADERDGVTPCDENIYHAACCVSAIIAYLESDSFFGESWPSIRYYVFPHNGFFYRAYIEKYGEDEYRRVREVAERYARLYGK